MEIKNIFEKFDNMNSYTFATIDGDYPETRIAHLLTYDDDGLYFQTMKVKPFYRQLKETNKVAICSLVTEQGAITHDDNGLPIFEPGFFIRANGDTREINLDELKTKSKKDSRFLPLLKDIERYPTMTTFVLYRFKGELYDYDFGKETRDHKLERERFSYGGIDYIPAGFYIDPTNCISCGNCTKVCSFNAIIPGEKYSINGTHCDECGSCYTVCPVNAIKSKTPMEDEDRKSCGKSIFSYVKSKYK